MCKFIARRRLNYFECHCVAVLTLPLIICSFIILVRIYFHNKLRDMQLLKLIGKKPAREVVYNQRHILGLTSHDQVDRRSLRQLFAAVAIVKRRGNTSAKHKLLLENLLKVVAVKYLKLSFVTD